MPLKIPSPGMGQAQKYSRIKPVNRIPTLPLNILLSFKKTTHYHNNEQQHTHGQYV